ncbi:MAG TPA: EAL domain-containing protein [Steroidobacteraceae bacterium]|jgi:diguanylate cyclase (GGDEF)-like protein|nr:EAL domain-containing protein [Steroidobacteraceae bacterium]
MSNQAIAIRVLIADDDAVLREIAAATLRQAGFSVQTVGSGDAAVAACAMRMPDIALLDVEMAEGNGYQACTNIRFLPGGADLPIVMVTGCDDSLSIDQAYEVGATDFVVKPINWTLLTHRIRYVMRGARTIEALRFSEQKNAALLKAIPDGICLVNSSGAIAHCFSPIDGLIQTSAEASAGQSLFGWMPLAKRGHALDCLSAALRGEPAVFEFSSDRDSRPTRHFECRYLPNTGGLVLAIIRDVSARKETDARLHRLAYFDALTGLPNREWICDFLAQAVAEARRRHRHLALLYVDLDQFKRINDTLGHGTGDALLRQVAERLQGAVDKLRDGAHGQIARLGGDEFMVILTGLSDSMQAEQAAQAILNAHAAPYLQANYELVVTPSIGVAKFPEHGDDVQSLLKNAEAAMYEAKSSGRNQLRVYDSAVNARALKRLSLEMELRRAVEDSSLEIYYQPKYQARSLALVGGEALLRWFHPERGQIPTAEFIAVAEETGLIGDIGKWTLQRVCRDLRQWRADGLALPRIAVNVSGRDFLQPEALLRLSDTVAQAGLPPSLFELELTEGVLMRDAEAGRRSLLSLKEFGFALAIDDFGTGYCSLNYLKRFPLDTLKIDRSFIADINEDPDDAAIVRAIIALGHSLDLKIVAEGVTSQAQLKFLRAEGCDAIQGFLLSAAVPAAAFAELLRRPHAGTRPMPARAMRHAG